MDRKKALGQRIKELRKKKHISQERLAELVGIEPPSICNIENGKNYPSIQNLEKIIDTLDVSFIDVFNYGHIQSNEILLKKINKLLLENPDKISCVYKIVMDIL